MGNGALCAGLEPGTPIVDSFVVLSEVSACMLVVAIMCMPFCATLSKSTLLVVEMLFVSQRALQRTYRRAGTLRSMDCVGSRCCIRLMMRLAVRLEVIGLSASRMSQGLPLSY